MHYWNWEREEMVASNVCGPHQTWETIDACRDSIVWSIEPRATDVCLDVGCGVGRVEKYLAPVVKEIHGVDFSQAMLAAARKRLNGCANVTLHHNDGENLAMFGNETFDLAWAELVFHHVPIEVTEGYLGEIARVLKPEGRFICQLPLRSFYRQHSRAVCGWLRTDEADHLMKKYFGRVEVSDNGRHIVAQGRLPKIVPARMSRESIAVS